MEWFSNAMQWLMSICYSVTHNFGVAIILFTFISKIILLPVSLWTYFNSITMVRIQPDINFIKVKYYGQKDMIAEEEAKIFKEKGYKPFLSVIPTLVQFVLLVGVAGAVRKCIGDPAYDTHFLGIDLALCPARDGIHLIWSPILAGIAALILCLAQNASNILQSEQSKVNKYGMMAFSVGLSLYLGWAVPLATAFYWICSNLLAVAQLYINNAIVRPRRFVDYEKLEESRKQLAELQGVGKEKKDTFFSENRRRERADYKRFFSVTNKHLVFYSESNGFYRYYRAIIEYLLNHSKIQIHYITSDPNDKIFDLSDKEPRIHAYYIGENRLITLMMKMDADVVCMTMPDLDNYHIKRSYVRSDIEYIYIPHGMASSNLTTRKGARDHFDTIFCAGPHQVAENTESEQVFGTKKKNNFAYGYPVLDDMIANYKKPLPHERKRIIIAPSWQKDNLIDLCLEPLLDQLKKMDAEITVRPHPQHIRHKGEWLKSLAEKYAKDGIAFQLDFSSGKSIMESDLLITDWSAVAWEFSFTTLHPTLFVNTPMKVMNPDWEKIATVPVNISLREVIGRSIDPDNLDNLSSVMDELLDNPSVWEDRIMRIRSEMIFNLGHSGEVGAEYILSRIREKIASRSK